MDGVCITYTRSKPPSSAQALDNSDNVFIGAFPHTDRWLTAGNDHGINDLFEKVRHAPFSLVSALPRHTSELNRYVSAASSRRRLKWSTTGIALLLFTVYGVRTKLKGTCTVAHN